MRRLAPQLIALALVIAALGGCGGDPAAPADAESQPTPPPPTAEGDGEVTPGADRANAGLEERSRPDRSESRVEPELALATKGNPAVWVLPGEKVAMHASPGGEVIQKVDRRTEFGSPTVFSVAERRGDWVGVTSPDLANNQLGWLELDPRHLGSGTSPYLIEVDLSDHTTTLKRGSETVGSFPVTVGAPGSPTPTGRFSVTDVFEGGLGPAYGCCAVAISANQPRTPSGWIGGRRIAIHGTDGTLGVDASHGCVRAEDQNVQALVDRVPLGTPVEIRQ
ncbi:L,D-transpeptidase [Thermoleophilia bacterium SCSIO 60948]|nr:L,D-transpeptidase [Thermoleophilia bacterium SCSIO 60948]